MSSSLQINLDTQPVPIKDPERTGQEYLTIVPLLSETENRQFL